MLTIKNNDLFGIKECGAPKELDLFDVLQSISVEEAFPWFNELDVEEIKLLVRDHDRVRCQGLGLIDLVPQYADKFREQMEFLVYRIEHQIEKLAKHNVRYRRN